MGEIFKNMRKHLMTGVSYMLPFVVAGGILLSLSVVLSGEAGVPESGWLNDLFFIGVAGFELMIPILAGYIAFSISERGGIAPAAIAAFVGNKMGTGFLGAIIAGIFAGVVVHYLKQIKVSNSLRSIMPIFIIPILSTLIVAGSMKWILGMPIASLTTGLTAWLNGLRGANILLLAAVMGCMTAFDMGGPINKVAFSFSIMAVSEGLYNIAALNSVAVCTPPIGMALATFIGRKKYNESEIEAGKAALLMGCVGITEGAIPFASASPLRVIPALMAGSAAGAMTAAILGVTVKVAWGGLIVIPAIGNILGYVVAIIVGSSVTALLAIALKSKDEIEKSSKISSSEDLSEIKVKINKNEIEIEL